MRHYWGPSRLFSAVKSVRSQSQKLIRMLEMTKVFAMQRIHMRDNQLPSCGSQNALMLSAASIWKVEVRKYPPSFDLIVWSYQGAPFHRAGERPRATCPICSSEKNDLTERTLYKVQGCSKGLYDDQIPSSWFETPPIKLDGTAKGGLDALRVWYMPFLT